MHGHPQRMSKGGYTDQEIADHIAERTGERFHRNKILKERRVRMIGLLWPFRSGRMASM